MPGFLRNLASLEAAARAHARVEDRIRCGKDTGLGTFPSHRFDLNAAWLTVALLAATLLAWLAHLALDGALAVTEPKTLRYRLFHIAARPTQGQRKRYLRLDQTWPWTDQLVTAYTHVAALPAPP